MSSLSTPEHAPSVASHGRADTAPELAECAPDITWLPDDVLATIFGYLEKAQDRLSAALVCREWNDLLHEAWLWQEVVFPTTIGSDETLKILSEPRMARVTKFSFSCAVKRNLPTRVGELCGARVTKLSFTNCTRKTNLRNTGLSAMASHCPRLEVLHLRGCTNVRQSTLACLPPSLREIDLSGCWHVNDDAVIELARKCPHLQVIALSGCESITDAALEALATLSELRVLKVWSCTLISDEGVAMLAATCTRLEEISLKNTAITDWAVLALATHCPLKRIDLSFCKRISDDSIHALGDDVDTLEHVALRGCAHLSTVKPLVRCPRLTHLDVRSAWRVGSRNVLHRLFHRTHPTLHITA